MLVPTTFFPNSAETRSCICCKPAKTCKKKAMHTREIPSSIHHASARAPIMTNISVISMACPSKFEPHLLVAECSQQRAVHEKWNRTPKICSDPRNVKIRAVHTQKSYQTAGATAICCFFLSDLMAASFLLSSTEHHKESNKSKMGTTTPLEATCFLRFMKIHGICNISQN